MRKRVKGKLYYLAKDAKARMRNYSRERSIFNQISYARSSMNTEDQELYNRVCKILSSERIVLDPIKELVDNRYYNSLTMEAKQRYIFNLSEKYKELKSRYEREHEDLANVSNI